ncbi:MAG: EVE domain-containing protein, partial [Rhodospirillaceae bacterium]|nr:EVE domain-containing protein [Rhodospirillaceae bacterium]
DSGRFGMVDFKAVKAVNTPVPLSDIKAVPQLDNMALVKQSRLSVCPVSEQEWNLIMAMAETTL